MKHKKSSIFALLFFTCCAVISCSDHNDSTDESIPRRDVELSRSETKVANGETYFALNFLKQSVLDAPQNNIAVSPYNVSTVLSMLANGAGNVALTEIIDAFAVDAADVASLNSLFKKFNSELPALDNRVELINYNGAFILPDLSFAADFTGILKDCYNSEIIECDLGTDAGIGYINGIISSKTNGIINNFLKEPKKDSPYLLQSTSYFKGKWRTPFDPQNTTSSSFYPEDKPKHSVKMMKSHVYCTGFYNDDYVYCRLPYGNAAFRMHIFMPTNYLTDESVPLNEFINKFDVDFWKENLAYGGVSQFNSTIDVYLPKFSLQTNGDIKQTLSELGINEIFKTTPDNLNGVLSNGNSFIREFPAEVVIEVEESGTTAASAAAATGGNIAPGPVSSLSFSHPFIFIIDEVSTGAILYAGAVRDIY